MGVESLCLMHTVVTCITGISTLVSLACCVCVCVCVRVCYHYLTSIGKDDSIGNMDNGMTRAVVMKLADTLKNRGHHVYTDNFYTSPALFADLRSKGFGACGTLRMNRRGIPPAIKPTIEKGATKVVNVDDTLVRTNWQNEFIFARTNTRNGRMTGCYFIHCLAMLINFFMVVNILKDQLKGWAPDWANPNNGHNLDKSLLSFV